MANELTALDAPTLVSVAEERASPFSQSKNKTDKKYYVEGHNGIMVAKQVVELPNTVYSPE